MNPLRPDFLRALRAFSSEWPDMIHGDRIASHRAMQIREDLVPFIGGFHGHVPLKFKIRPNVNRFQYPSITTNPFSRVPFTEDEAKLK